MAVKQLPTIQTIFSGEGITSDTKSISFELDEKIETTYNVVVDNPLEIDFSFIEKVKTFIFNTDNPFILTLSIDIGTEEIPNIVDVPIEVTSMFRLDPSENFLATLSKIVISTTSVNGSKVNCRIYGEEWKLPVKFSKID